MDEDKLVHEIEKTITKYRKKPKTYMDTIIYLLRFRRDGKKASYHRVINDLFREDLDKAKDIKAFQKKKRNLLDTRRRTINRRIYDSDLCFKFFIDFDGKYFYIITDPEAIYKKWLAEFKLRRRKESKETREKLIKDLTDELDRKYEEFKINNPVLKFLEDIQKHIEDDFKRLTFFKSIQNFSTENQYIPVNVTLERTYRHNAGSGFRFAERERDYELAYAFKGLFVGSQFDQTLWDTVKKQDEEKGIMVLANPGMGKSTLLRREAWLLASEEKQKLTEDQKALDDVVFPLFFKLFELEKEKEEIFDAILSLVKRNYPKTSLKIMDVLKKKLETGRCLLLLDSLDGVPIERRNNLSERLSRFARNYHCSIICTSRIVGYIGTFLYDAKEVEIVPFDHKQIEQFVTTWFTNVSSPINKDYASADGFLKELQGNPQVRGLSQNPLFLSLMCDLYHRNKISFPIRRSQICEKVINFMLGEWRLIPTTKLLRELAYHFSFEGKEIFSAEELHSQIEKYLKGKTVASDFKGYNATDLIREISEVDGILIKTDQQRKNFTFLHRIFQEYLTASFLNQVIEDNKEKGQNLIKERLWDFDWQEVLVLLAGLMDDPTLLIKTIKDEYDDIFKSQLILVGRCITECELNFNPMVAGVVKDIISFWAKYSSLVYIKSTIIDLGKKYSEVFDMLSDYLCSKKSNLDTQTVLILEAINTPQTTNILTHLLKNKDSCVRSSAAYALGRIGGNEAINSLIDAFMDEDTIVRFNIALSLGNIGDGKAFKLLIYALKDKSHYVRAVAAYALWQIGKDKAFKLLIYALKDKSDSVRAAAAFALWQMSMDKDIKPPNDALKDDDTRVRSAATFGLKSIYSDKSIKALIGALKDKNIFVRCFVTEALGRFGDDNAVKPLIDAIKNKGFTLKGKAAFALGIIGGDKAINQLIDALKDKDASVRVAVTEALGKFGGKKAFKPLIYALKDKDANVRSAAAKALGMIDNDKSIKLLIEALNDKNTNVRAAVAATLGIIGSDEAIKPLIDVLKNKDASIRPLVAAILGIIGNDKAIKSLIDALKDKDASIRAAVAATLGIISDDKTIKPLSDALKDKDASIRASVAATLGIIGGDEAIKLLSDALKDDNSSVKSEAGFSLIRIGSNKAIDALIQNLKNKNGPYDKYFFIFLLRQIGSLEILEKLIKLPEIDIYNSIVSSFARDLAIRNSKKENAFHSCNT